MDYFNTLFLLFAAFANHLVSPLTNVVNDSVRAQRIGEVARQYLQKLQEISDLGKVIAEKNEQFFLHDASKRAEHFTLLFEQKAELAKKNNGGNDLSQEEVDAMVSEELEWQTSFVNSYMEAIAHKTDVTFKLFRDENDKRVLDPLRLSFARHFFEHIFINELLCKYEIYVKQLATLCREFNALNEQEAA